MSTASSPRICRLKPPSSFFFWGSMGGHQQEATLPWGCQGGRVWGTAGVTTHQVSMSLGLGRQQSPRVVSSPRASKSSSLIRSERKPGASNRGRPPKKTKLLHQLLAPARSLRGLHCLSSRRRLRLWRASHQRHPCPRVPSRHSLSTTPSLSKCQCLPWAPFLLQM